MRDCLAITLALALSAVPATTHAESPSSSSDGLGFEDRVALRLGAGLSAHTLDDANGPFFFADFGASYGVSTRTALEFEYTFTFLRMQDSRDELLEVASQVFAFMLGARHRFFEPGDEPGFVPYGSAHLGFAFTRDDLQVGAEDLSETGFGFVFDLRPGVEWFVTPSVAIDLFASYNFVSNVPALIDRRREMASAHYFFVGAGIVLVL